jgi:hypothetical protein
LLGRPLAETTALQGQLSRALDEAVIAQEVAERANAEAAALTQRVASLVALEAEAAEVWLRPDQPMVVAPDSIANV